VEAVIARLDPAHGREEVLFTAEAEYFPPPRALRELLSAIDVAASLALAAPRTPPTRTDRDVAASDVLATLSS
ncbi:MAG: 4-hydroxy-3-methylbut-2-enyl diphosphate reductase, partial [Acidimicrobiia bacterium]|nr:4-hydroxy-3-methylbut-2-enyl diphosphate reductase [Acidimicrobiia bacterium]